MCGVVATQNLEIAEMTFDSKGREDIYDWVFIILFLMLAQSLVISWVWSLPWTKGSQNKGTCAKGVMAHGFHGASAPAGLGGGEWQWEAHQGTSDPSSSFLPIGDTQRIYM